MAKIGIYLPKYMRKGDEALLKPIDDNVLRKEVLNMAKLMTDLTGGCTSIEVTGYYKFPDGFFSEAPTMEIYCFCDNEKTGEVAAALKPRLTDIKLRLGQNSVGMYIAPDFKFIEG